MFQGWKNISHILLFPKRYHPTANVINKIPTSLGVISKALAEITGRQIHFCALSILWLGAPCLRLDSVTPRPIWECYLQPVGFSPKKNILKQIHAVYMCEYSLWFLHGTTNVPYSEKLLHVLKFYCTCKVLLGINALTVS